MGKTIIFHIDVNSAFLSWEAVYRQKHLGMGVDLRTIPSAVGGDSAKRHGIILAKSIPAGRYQIKTGEPVVDAVRKCPGLVLAAPHYELYEKNSRAFLEVLKKYSPVVEQYSIDEAYLDMTGCNMFFTSAVQTAHAIKDEIRRELGFTVNVGISSNKLLAKMAGGFKKPDRVHTLFPEEIKEKMWPLPVGKLFFVGSASEKKLYNLGISTIGELACSDEAVIKSVMKRQGEIIWNFANGRDTSLVEEEPLPNKGYGNSTTLSQDILDKESAGMVLLSLAETVGVRLRRDHVKVKVISVGLRLSDFTYSSHQMVLPQPTNITRELYLAACRLFLELWDGGPIRHMGLHTAKAAKGEEYRQLSFFEEEFSCQGFTYDNFSGHDASYEKWEKLDNAMDRIRLRYGKDAVKRACFLKQDKVEHMSGGIAKENRRADYSKV